MRAIALLVVAALSVYAAAYGCSPKAVDCRVEFLRAPDGGKEAAP
jgi:hypothetical protein